MSGVATAIVGSAVVGAYVSNQAAGRASDAQRDAANSSNDTQRYIYNQNRNDNESWRQAGEGALKRMQDPNLANTLAMDPGYQFRLEQGNKAMNAGLAARGMGNSGAALKSLSRYGQDYASNEFSNAYNRLSSLAGVGQTANQNNQASGSNYANGVSANNAAVGNAAAANYIGQANNFNSVLSSGANAFAYSKYLNKFPDKSPMNLGSSPSYALPPGAGHGHWNQA